MVIRSNALPAAPAARHAHDCSGCSGRVPTRVSLTSGALEHLGAGFVLACSASALVTQPLPRDWFVPAAAVHTPPLRPVADAASRATTQRISFDAAAELAKWAVLS